MSKFLRAASVHDIPPGTGKPVALGGREIAIFNLDGEFYAIDNTCPHRGGSLGAGAVEGDEVLCPLHGWQFNIRTGQLPMGGGGVRTYPVKIDGEDVLVEI